MVRALPLFMGLLVVPAALPVAAAGTAQPDATAMDAHGTQAPLLETNTTSTATSNETTRPGIDDLAFFTTYSRGTAPPVRIGFSARAGADGFFVLEDRSGAVLGTTEYQSFEGSIHADGMVVPLTEPVSGLANLTVVAYYDTNENHQFDPGVDEPYREADGTRVASSLWFVVPNLDGNVTGETVELQPPDPGATGLHHFELDAQRDMRVRAVAVDYRYMGIDVSGVDSESAGVGMVLPGKSNTRTDAARVEEPTNGVLVIYPEDPFDVGDGERFLLNVDGLEMPRRPTNVTVLANPYGNGSAAMMTLEPNRSVPEIQTAQVSPADRSTVSVNLYFPAGRTGVVQVEKDGTVIGRSQVVGGQPDMHVDFLEVHVDEPLEPGEEITVTLYRDIDADNQYEEPFRVQGEPVARTITVLDGLETPGTPTTTSSGSSGTPSTDSTTRTSTPGFGVAPVLAGVLLMALLALFGWRAD